MKLIISLAPLVFVLLIAYGCHCKWRYVAGLAVLGPIAATFLLLLATAPYELFIDTSSGLSLNHLHWFFIFGFLIFGAWVFYPWGFWVAGLTLIAGHLATSITRGKLQRRLLSGLIVGAVIGILTAAAMLLLSQLDWYVNIVAAPGDPNSRHAAPLSAQIVILNGVCDGLLLAYLTRNAGSGEFSKAAHK